MTHKNVLITGAAGALGSAFTESFNARPDFVNKLELADLKQPTAPAIRNPTIDVRHILGNLFHAQDPASREVLNSAADIVVWNAAVNVDALPNDDREPMRRKQTASLEEELIRLRQSRPIDAVSRRLLIVVNSISAIFGQELEFARNFAATENLHYGAMKLDQLEILRFERNSLEDAGVDVSILQPGSFRSGFTDADQALKNANGFGKRVRGYQGRQNLKQDRILEPREITDAVTNMAQTWAKTGTLPEYAKEWIMLNEADLQQN